MTSPEYRPRVEGEASGPRPCGECGLSHPCSCFTAAERGTGRVEGEGGMSQAHVGGAAVAMHAASRGGEATGPGGLGAVAVLVVTLLLFGAILWQIVRTATEAPPDG